MLKKVCSWSRLISACSQYIWPQLLDCSYAADSFGGMGTVVQLCSCALDCCVVGQNINAAWSLVLSSSFGVLAAWCSWRHEQSRSFMGAASECCPGQLPNTLRCCTLAQYLLEAVQKIQFNLLLHSCTLFIRGSGSKNTTQLADVHLHIIY